MLVALVLIPANQMSDFPHIYFYFYACANFYKKNSHLIGWENVLGGYIMMGK